MQTDTYTCALCGFEDRSFNGPCSNYGMDDAGNKYCADCCAARDREEMAKRHKAGERFVAYVQGNGCQISTWHGRVLGFVYDSWRTRRNGGWVSRYVNYYKVQDDAGRYWGGYSGGDGLCITLRPVKR